MPDQITLTLEDYHTGGKRRVRRTDFRRLLRRTLPAVLRDASALSLTARGAVFCDSLHRFGKLCGAGVDRAKGLDDFNE